MNAKKWIALVLFALAVAFDLAGVHLDIPLMERVAKPLLMPLVLLNALLALEDTLAPKWLATLLTFALCFHCAGDTFLMFGAFPLFVAGLLCFLAGHLFYVAIFAKEGVFEQQRLGWRFLSTFVVSLIPVVLVNLLDFEGPIKYAVVVYAFVLLYVVLCGLVGALNKRSGVSHPAYWLVFAGGLIFLFSDFLVAWRSILGHGFPHIGLVIMVTYILAECLIVTGIVRPYLTAGRRQG
ncbi:MAG: lysoplasmalogenase [Bacteroidales bacterium]|nr:lysoplasmalogenase [Bacteroidales bacterium]